MSIRNMVKQLAVEITVRIIDFFARAPTFGLRGKSSYGSGARIVDITP